LGRGSKYVFKLKRHPDGSIEKYKARNVCFGHRQILGIDHDNNNEAPVADSATIRLVTAIAVANDLTEHQVDVGNAYLEATLEQTIYVKPPVPETGPDGSPQCWLLHKALYGLRQAGKAWFDCLSTWLLDYGFQRSQLDPCLFVLLDTRGDILCLVPVHVDDLKIAHIKGGWWDNFRTALEARFTITWSPLTFYLGIEYTYHSKGVTMHQTGYIEHMLDIFNMAACSPADVPMLPATQIIKADAPSTDAERAIMSKVPYGRAVGMLNWLSVMTRPDITYTVSRLASVLADPGLAHWEAAKLVMRYLAGTKTLGITFSKDPRNMERNTLVAFCDSDYAGDIETRRSHIGYALFFNDGPIAWKSSQYKAVTKSTCEAEYIAASHAGTEIMYMRQLLQGLGGPYTPRAAIELREDNAGCIALARAERVTKRSKHIDVHYHWLREAVRDLLINITHWPTSRQIADLLTKPLGRIQFAKLRSPLMGGDIISS
jgi:hypothetical protein